jgi:hypothetical protein
MPRIAHQFIGGVTRLQFKTVPYQGRKKLLVFPLDMWFGALVSKSSPSLPSRTGLALFATVIPTSELVGYSRACLKNGCKL